MNNMMNMDRILEFKLTGKFAHFRKFYTNASSLSYLIPPRTAICGLLASILKIPRDGYYELMSAENLAITISIPAGSSFIKIFQTLNYAQDKSSSTPINDLSAHKQCRLELLKAEGNKELVWNVYIGYRSDSIAEFPVLESKILAKDFGYGLYLGQRQFIAHIDHTRTFSKNEFTILENSDYLDSAVCKENIEEILGDSYQLSMERMPLEQTLQKSKAKYHRQSIRFGDIVVEMTGQRIKGSFRNIVELKDTESSRISFL